MPQKKENICCFCTNTIHKKQVCDSCVNAKEFISIYEAKSNYNLLPRELHKLTKYNLRTSGTSIAKKFYFGPHILMTDINEFIKNNDEYYMRNQKTNDLITYYTSQEIDEKELNDYMKKQRELYLISVFKKTGIFELDYSKYFTDTYILDFLHSGNINNLSICQYENYLYWLIYNNFHTNKKLPPHVSTTWIISKPYTSYSNKYQKKIKNNFDEKIKDKIDEITIIMNMSHEKLSENHIYKQYINYGLPYINNDDNDIKTVDDLIGYLIEYFDY